MPSSCRCDHNAGVSQVCVDACHPAGCQVAGVPVFIGCFREERVGSSEANGIKLQHGCLRQTPQSRDEMVPLYSPKLISHNLTVFALLKPETHTKRLWVSASCEWHKNECSKPSIQFVWRNSDTWSLLPDCRSSRGIQCDKEEIAFWDVFFHRHDHSLSTHRLALI